MSRTSAHRTIRTRGFTLVELMVAGGIATIVIAGVLSAYIFMGRNLARLISLQSLEASSRRAVQHFVQDAGAAIQLTTCTSAVLTLQKQGAGGKSWVHYDSTTVAGALVRKEAASEAALGSASALTLVTGITALTFSFYNESGTAVSGSPQSIKAVELSFTCTTGSAPNGTLVNSTSVSPRVILRNKPLLE